MSESAGIYKTAKKSGEIYYRASITYKNKHISLGSYPCLAWANSSYRTAQEILSGNIREIEDYKPEHKLSFEKWVILINFRDNGIYFKNPIYLKNRYFLYYIDKNHFLKFDVDDLFYYANHKIMKRGGYLFVSDYGMQTNILSRYGVRNHAVSGRDYRFANGDDTDYRYGNIHVINRYYGVSRSQKKGKPVFTAKIHVNGDFIIGRYPTEAEAAIAYTKAAALLREKGINIQFPENYIKDMDEIEYVKIYNSVRISKKIRNYSVN